MGKTSPARGLTVVLLVATAVTTLVTAPRRVPPASADRSDGRPVAWQVDALPAAAGGLRASFGEPGIAVGGRGELVVNAARANAGHPTWWSSMDDGRHWGPGRDLDPSGAMTGDADAAFGPDGYLYVLNLAFDNPPAQPINPTILVSASRDGRRFVGPAAFPPPHGTDQPDRPWLVVDPYRSGRVLVTNSEGIGDVVTWTSTDHARSFSGPTLVTGGDHAASIELTSRPLFDTVDHGRLYMLYEAGDPTGLSPPTPDEPLRDFPVTQLWLARSDDAGRTWTNRLVYDLGRVPGGSGGSLGHVLPASAIDRAGNLYAAFSRRLATSTQTHVFLVHSTDHGAHWSRPARVDSGGLRSNVMPSLAAGSPGRVDVSWYASTSPDFTDSRSRWVEMFAQTLDALSARPTFVGSRVSDLAHTGSVDSSGNPGSSQYDWGLRDFQSIAVDACGMAHLAWTDDVGRGSTMVARQVAGPSLLPRSPC
jgi:hypothetical protein